MCLCWESRGLSFPSAVSPDRIYLPDLRRGHLAAVDEFGGVDPADIWKSRTLSVSNCVTP